MVWTGHKGSGPTGRPVHIQMPQPTEQQVHIRLSYRDYEEIRRLALEENRSIAGQIRKMLDESLKARHG